MIPITVAVAATWVNSCHAWGACLELSLLVWGIWLNSRLDHFQLQPVAARLLTSCVCMLAASWMERPLIVCSSSPGTKRRGIRWPLGRRPHGKWPRQPQGVPVPSLNICCLSTHPSNYLSTGASTAALHKLNIQQQLRVALAAKEEKSGHLHQSPTCVTNLDYLYILSREDIRIQSRNVSLSVYIQEMKPWVNKDLTNLIQQKSIALQNDWRGVED